MVILIDGYNVLKQVYDGQMISEQQRLSFIKQLALYKRLRSHKKITIVFDGGLSSWPSHEKIRGINIVYAGAERTADEYIYLFIEEHKTKAANMLLVSSDLQLCKFASDYGVSSISSSEFYDVLQERIRPIKKRKINNQRVVKTATNSSPDVDALMQEASTHAILKEENVVSEWKSEPDKKLSKQERALLKKIQKL
jgi:predicted RNA-binding protein with PIN domain